MRWSRADALCGACAAVALVVVGLARAPLAARYGTKVSGHDVYALAPPDRVVTGSLGYRSALADLLFAHVMVSAGLHLQEKRLFEFAPEYIDTINALDPKFRDGYRFADAIITLQTVHVPPEMYRRARTILERGTRELPYDQELWSAAGQFMAYLAPSQLGSEQEGEAWRQAGARMLARACELIGSNENIPYHCLTAATLFSQGGNLAASRSFLEKLQLMTDNPEIRALADSKLQRIGGEQVRQVAQERAQRFERAWRDDLPYVSRSAMSAIGPRFDPFACAGLPSAARDPSCSTSFRDKSSELAAAASVP